MVIIVDPTIWEIYLVNYAIFSYIENDYFIEEVGSHFLDGMTGQWNRGMCYEHLYIYRQDF